VAGAEVAVKQAGHYQGCTNLIDTRNVLLWQQKSEQA